ncbi:MAG TPA: hypothetical protein PKD78_04160 [Saprospiraceae bacterium]|nr:hypothetical protein [Saprospiraceae bacterium]HNG88726.1 hypothetical protein [Saprospiraceae bacterium]
MRPLFFFFCLLCTDVAFGQQTPADTLPFPASWAGNWSGKLDIYSPKGIAQTIPMALEINKIDTSLTGRYTWGMVYVSKEKDWRPYELVPVNPARGQWRVDEKNSISMESYLFGPKLLCWFVVEGNRILCTYEKTDANTIIFEVMSGKEVPASTTGNTRQGEEDIPEVKAYPFHGFQRGVLKRG